MSWAEAWRLTALLAADPSSQVGAAFAGWQYPVQRTDLTMRDLFDLQHKSKTKRKIKPYPRPWDTTKSTRMGGTGHSVSDYHALMARQELDSSEGGANA